jgi:hypothetical protein
MLTGLLEAFGGNWERIERKPSMTSSASSSSRQLGKN